ncbi:MAG: hypothetical protein JO033_08455 [Acidobacteriaceae bacterium]|nr:hypothetical protein [Acidobacteriaceae bacterium]MBV9499527.1 hypothetical protein [Acidobacteriaceae bacterium]
MRNKLLTLTLLFGAFTLVPAYALQNSAGQDAKDLGHDSKMAAKKGYTKSTEGAKKGTEKTTDAVKTGTEKTTSGTKKGYHKTKNAVKSATSDTTTTR